MDENGKFPDYAEIWVNAYRARNVCLALSFALITAAFTQSWKSLQQQTASDKEVPLPPGSYGSRRRQKGQRRLKGKGPLDDASRERVLKHQRLRKTKAFRKPRLWPA